MFSVMCSSFVNSSRELFVLIVLNPNMFTVSLIFFYLAKLMCLWDTVYLLRVRIRNNFVEIYKPYVALPWRNCYTGFVNSLYRYFKKLK